MVPHGVHGGKNEPTTKRETFSLLKRKRLAKSLSFFAAMIVTDSIFSASQSLEISSSAALGIPSLYFGKGARTEIFMASRCSKSVYAVNVTI